MDTLGFFGAVWPSVGPYLIAIPRQWNDPETGELKKGFKHFSHDTKQAAVAHAQALATDRDAPQDVYFALGSIKEVRPKKIRVKDNIAKLRAFWIDIDVGDEAGKYVDIPTAASNLKTFVKQLGLPKPMVVGSGGGLHVYWPLDADVDTEQWNHYAGLLKGLTKTWNLRVDHSRTSDSASVLRPVGTYNWKTGQPREVKVLMPLNGPIATTTMLARIAAAAERLNVKPQQASNTAASLGLTGHNPATTMGSNADNHAAAQGAIGEDIPSDPKKVVARCQQLKWQAINAQQVDEPQWYAMIGCLRHAEKGDKAVHAMSKQYSGYSASETDDKIAHHREGNFGPTTCIAFDNARPGGCDGCPHKGKITTPLQLGRERPTAPAPTQELVTLSNQGGQQVQMQLPDPPAPFKRAIHPQSGQTCITVKVVNEDDDEQEVMIYEHDVYPCGLIFDERQRKFMVVIRRFLPKDGWADFEVSLGKLYDKRNLAILLGDIGVLPDFDKIESLVHYMIAYIKQLQKSAKAAMLYASLGWREEGNDLMFVLPDRIVTPQGSEPINPSRNITNALSWKEPKGDIAEWRKVTSLYEAPGLEAHLFGYGVGFAAPLFHFTEHAGMIVSLVGSTSAGKSSVLKAANSIWGHPTFSWANMKGDTANAFYNKLGVLNNLMVSYDEITNLEPDMLSNLCYTVTQGQGRQRLDKDGGAKENHGNWHTMMLVTSNQSLHNKLTLAKANSQAEAVRVFEYAVPSHQIPLSVAKPAFENLTSHYGLAGPIYIAEVMKDVAKVRDRIRYWTAQIDQATNADSVERFWSAGAACVLAGFEVANACGVANADIGRLLQFVIDTINKMRTVVAESVRSGFGIISDYLNGNLHKTLALNTQPQPGHVAIVAQEPRGELRIRYERWHGRLFMDRADFRRFCAEKSVDSNTLKAELLGNGILKSEKRISLGKDTAFGAGQTYCWELDMNHPLMGGTQATVNSSTGIANQTTASTQGATTH